MEDGQETAGAVGVGQEEAEQAGAKSLIAAVRLRTKCRFSFGLTWVHCFWDALNVHWLSGIT